VSGNELPHSRQCFNTLIPLSREWPMIDSIVNGKWLPDFIERLKASAWHQLYLPLLPFTHARSESINADSLKLQLLTTRLTVVHA